MTTQLIKLQALLRELFQLDQADLDFGIYRIMALRRDEITRFLDQDLLPQVRATFEQFRPADRAHTERQLAEAVAQAQTLGVDPEQTPKVKELREKLGEAVDVAKLEADVYDHLYDFFRRYYTEGDFISQRRYKEGVYAIPYEGEEVKLYWANHDQYYIKSAETLTSYAFKTSDGRRVRFELAAAAADRDNVKAATGQERRFILHEADPVAEDVDGLAVRFEYRPDEQGRKQAELSALAAQGILAAAPNGWKAVLTELAPTEASPGRTVLEKHIAAYTARNTFDYFIHKDLGGFLRRELDFYIKNEVLHLDDIDQADMARVEQALSVVKALRQIAHKLIDFLASIEDFQKRLWLKKKFVVETNWCITLDRVPEEFYPEIAANDAQREEWVRLFAIDEIKGDLIQAGYSTPLSVDFLRSNHFLVLDTRFFSIDFRERLIADLSELDEQIDGVLLHSENYQALRLLMQRYRGQVRCIYIDPPYNTGNDGFPYKDSYQHSSWLAMIVPRLELGRALMGDESSLFVSIDDNEADTLQRAGREVFGNENGLATIIWQKVFSPKNTARHFSDDHEYIQVWAKKGDTWIPTLLPRSEEADARYTNPDNDPRGPWSSSDLTARNYYSLGTYQVTGPTGRRFGPGLGRYWRSTQEKFMELDRDGRVWWGEDGNNMPRLKRFLSEVKQGIVPQTLWTYDEVGHTQDAKKELLATVRFVHTSDVLNTVKPTKLIRRVVQIGTRPDARDVVLDFFAGSGTTGQAVLRQNQEDNGNRVFILSEMGEYFDTMTKQRVVSSMYSTEWKGFGPIQGRGTSALLKYCVLESYEDVLDNLVFTRTSTQQSLLGSEPAAREDFMLHYLLDLDTRGSPSLLDVQRFANPFDYKLKITRNYEQRDAVVDLVETFNYLLGLRVDHMAARIHRTADFERDEHGRLMIKDGRTRACPSGEGWTFRTITGRSPAGDKVLVVWRTLTGDAERDNAMLDLLFARWDIRPRDQEFDLIYVNGDNNLENLRRPDETWKVRLIEEDYHRLMWDVQDV